ncbi:hypothetical protein AZA_06630 [Nitrospirillum viridazoti Y2]|nr:hypothetical protein AZA_06630 [Nitrospirillum amazonense Y2]
MELRQWPIARNEATLEAVKDGHGGPAGRGTPLIRRQWEMDRWAIGKNRQALPDVIDCDIRKRLTGRINQSN